MWKYRKFRLSSPPEAGIRSPPVSGPRPRFSSALLAGRVPRPPPGLFPRAQSRGRPPPPSTTTLNCACSGGSCGDGETSRVYVFYVFSGECCDVGVFCRRELRYLFSSIPLLFDISVSWSRPFSPDNLPGRVAFSLFHSLRLASAGYEYV